MSGDLPSPRLERPAGTPLAGVCAALARTTGTDPLLWRVGAVVLVLFHGAGLVLYLLGYVLIPAEGEQQSLALRLLHGPDRRLTGRQVVVLVVLLVGLLALQQPDAVLVLLLVAALAWLWWRNHEHAPAVPPAAQAAPVAGLAPAASQAPGPVPAPVRRSSPYGGLVASLALLAASVLYLVGTTTSVSVPAEVVVAAALAVVGLGLVGTSFSGSSPGLVGLAVLLAVGLALTAGVQPVADRGVGERTWRPVASGDYRLGVGDATLDLHELGPGAPATVTARVEVGQLTVVVPSGVHLVLDARADLGDLDVLGDTRSGRHVSRHVALGPLDQPAVRVRAVVRLGQVEVRRG